MVFLAVIQFFGSIRKCWFKVAEPVLLINPKVRRATFSRSSSLMTGPISLRL